MINEIKLNQTKEEAAIALVSAHCDQMSNPNTCHVYVDLNTNKIDYSFYQTPSNAIDLYKINEWTLGDYESTDFVDGEPTDDFFTILVDSAMDQHGFNMVPSSVFDPETSNDIELTYKDEQ